MLKGILLFQYAVNGETHVNVMTMYNSYSVL